MDQERTLTRARLTTPRAAAIAGILFSLLLITSLVLIRLAVPLNPQDSGDWLADGWRMVSLALNLLPFAGIAFLWFIGVVRDRMAEAEDRLFATIFLGSGLLFLAMMFVAIATFGAIVTVHMGRPGSLASSTTFALARAFAFTIVNVYAVKMAGVFMLITSTIAVRTAFVARWMAAPGFAMALFLLFAGQWIDWSFIVFPAWVFLISVYILIANFYRQPTPQAD